MCRKYGRKVYAYICVNIHTVCVLLLVLTYLDWTEPVSTDWTEPVFTLYSRQNLHGACAKTQRLYRKIKTTMLNLEQRGFSRARAPATEALLIATHFPPPPPSRDSITKHKYTETCAASYNMLPLVDHI